MRAYKANMIPGGTTPVINVSQYDNDYAVTVTLIEGAEIYTPPVGATIRVEGTKPDGHGFEYPCTYQGNVVTMPIYTQMTAVAGRFPIELVVYQNSLRVGSCNIIFAVERAPLGEDVDISETVIPDIIAGAQAQADAAAASATQAASSAASAETAKTAAMDAAQDAIDAAQELQTAIQFNSALIHETASGAVASFADGADNIPMQSVVAEITPVQNLNGQANPYPAGGGKNKLPDNGEASASKYGVTFTRNADGTIKAVGTATEMGRSTFDTGHVVLPAGTYTISGCPSGGADSTYRIRIASGSYVGTALAQEYGTGKTITLSEETDVYLRIYIQPASGAVDQIWKPQIESGSTATDYEPYSNICPITGRTGLTVTRAGKNLLPKYAISPSVYNNVTFTVNDDGSVSAVGTASATCNAGNAISGIGGEYILTGCPSGGGASTYQIWVYDQTTGVAVGAADTGNGATVTLDKTHTYSVRLRVQSGYTINKVFYPMLRPASITDDTYEPYNAQTIPITWESIAGTVYGGTLDVVSGVLTVDRSIVDLGDMTWGWSSNGYFFSSTIQNLVEPPKTASEKTTAVCSMYKAETTDDIQLNTVDNAFGVVQVNSGINTGRVWIRDTSKGTDTAAFKTAVTGQTLVYPLATPQTYQLTPTDVRTLLGGNSIYTDAGDVSVEYIADTKLYIDNKIAELQALVLEN